MNCPTSNCQIGQIYRTAYDPCGYFVVTDIASATDAFPETVYGKFVYEHPRGYPAGAVGCYLAVELKGREVDLHSLDY